MEFLFLTYLIINSVKATTLDIPEEARMTRGKTRYTLFTDKHTWKNARDICRRSGGYLMNVVTQTKYNILQEIKDDFSSDFDTPWIGLYWSSGVDMHTDGTGCPPPRVSLDASYNWKSTDERLYKSSELCYREHDGLESKQCKEKHTFICETYEENGGCWIESSDKAAFDVKKINQSTLASCAVLCNTTDGCFLTGAVNSSYCAMLLTQDVSNSSLGVKNCPYRTAINKTVFVVTLDETNPTDCIAVPNNQSNSTIGCPTIVEQVTETINVTVIETDVITDYITETIETTILETVSHEVPTTIHSTHQLTVTTTEQLVTTQATTITPTNILTTVVQPTTTVVSTVTDTVSDIVSSTVISTQIVTVTTTEQLPGTQVVDVTTITPSHVISTVIQPTTVTIDASTVIVTVTETPTPVLCPIPTTLTLSVPCTDINISPSVGASICIEQTSATQVSVGSLGFVDPEGVLRTNICHDVIVVTEDESATSRAVSSIVNELTVEKSNISAVYNKKNSATDSRPSSTAIGYIGIILFTLPFLLLLALDGITLMAKAEQFGFIKRQK